MEDFAKNIYDVFLQESTKIKDNKIISLNLLNKRLLKHTNYQALSLWTFERVGSMVKTIMQELEMNELQASEELKRRIKNDETMGRIIKK